MRSRFCAFLLVFLAAAPSLYADPVRTDSYSDQALQQRIYELEAQTQVMQSELSRIRQQYPVRLPATTERSVPVQNVSNSYLEYAPVNDADYYTLDELKGEMKKLAWKKGDFTITPYGFLWGSMAYETQRSNTGDYAFYIFSEQDQPSAAFHADAKPTRLGIDILGPRIPMFNCAQSGGKVEIDFQGAFITENKPGLLLRHAYWEVKDETFRILGGQTWDVISPLNPSTIMYSVYWGAGNIGYRRAQFRGERYFALSDYFMITTQGSINADIVSDRDINTAGDHSDWPVLEGRVAMTCGERGVGCQPVVLGVSSHVGEQRFSFGGPNPVQDLPAKTWSLNVDFRAPMTERLGVQGEYFTGENLGAYLGGILQGYNFVQRKTIYSRGGWVETWYDWTPRLHSHAGYTIDDPVDSDIFFGGRTYNQAYYMNFVYDITKQFTAGFEVSQWKTLYQGKLPGEATRYEFVTKYNF